MGALYDTLSTVTFWLWGLVCLGIGLLIVTLVAWRWALGPLVCRLARLLGWLGLLLRTGWIVALVGFVAMFLGVWYLFSPMMDEWLHLPTSWFNLWTILAAYTLIWLLIWAWRARRQLVVEEFKNYVGDDLNASVKGAATLLVVRLSQFHDLYRTVDEQRAIPTSALRSEGIDAAIDLENIGTVLKDAVSSQSTLSLGPLTIPVGTLMSLLGHAVRGPRIIGSLHKDKGMLILTAQCMREGSSFKWRVDSLLASEQASLQSPRSLGEMIEELSCRIFTDLTLNSSVRWRATSSFSRGLRAYRECLRTPKDRRANLREAENNFIETLTEDTKFNLAYYNLGVVYSELGYKKAAKTAFEQAIAQDPTSWAAYYARALSCCESEEYYRSIQLCKRVIELKPSLASRAKAYQLMASVQRLPNTKTESQDFPAAIKNCKEAIRHAYRALLQAEVVRQDDNKVAKLRTLLVVCVTDLAMIYNTQANDILSGRHETARKLRSSQHEAVRRLKKAENLLKTVRSLKSSDATYYALYLAVLAETYRMQEKYAEAAHMLRVATRVAPDHVQYWGDLAVAYANAIGNRDKSRDKEKSDSEYQEFILRTILDFASDKAEEDFGIILTRVEKAYKGKPNQTDKSERIKNVREFLHLGSTVSSKIESGEWGIPDLEAQLQEHTSNILHTAQIALALGKLYLESSKDGQSGENNLNEFHCLVKKLGKLEQKFAASEGENKEWEHGQILRILALLYSEASEGKRRATGNLAQDERKEHLEQAMKYYKKAIQVLEKKHPREIRIQGLRSKHATILLELQRYQEALQEAQEAIRFDALAYDNHEVLGDVYAERGDFEHAIDAWKEAILRRDVTELASYGPELHVKIGKAYVKLAQLHSEMCMREGKTEEAVRSMQQALKCCDSEHLKERLEIYYSLGYFYFALGEYEETLKYLRLARNFGFAPLTSTFYLAFAYLRNREYDASMKEFCSLREMTQKEQGRLGRIVEKDSVGHIPLGEMRALAYWGQAFIYAERDANLHGALELAEKALEHIESMKATSTILQFPARYTDCKGWILYKQGKTDEAITCLEQSVAQEAQAETYLHLALAYESKVHQTSKEAEKRQYSTRLQACSRHVCELDVNKRFCQQVEHLREIGSR